MRTEIQAALLAALLCSSVWAASTTVRFDQGKLWVSSRAAPPSDVFAAIADKTGVRFVLDSELRPAPLTIEIEGMDLERGLRNIITSIPEVAGHTMSYANGPSGEPRLSEVSIFGPGKSFARGGAVYEPNAPVAFPTPDLAERLDRMVEAGVPRETAEKVMSLTAEVQKLQVTPEPGSYSADDLSADTREQLQPLIDRGVSMERAVQMLLLQEKYQETLKELSTLPGGVKVPGMPGSPADAPSPNTAAGPGTGE